MNKVNNPQALNTESKSELNIIPKNEDGPLKNQEVRLTKLVPKMGKINSDMDAVKSVKSQRLEVKK